MRELARGLSARKLPSFSVLGRRELEAGLLMTTGGAERDIERLARRVVLMIQRIARGRGPGDVRGELPHRSSASSSTCSTARDDRLLAALGVPRRRRAAVRRDAGRRAAADAARGDARGARREPVARGEPRAAGQQRGRRRASRAATCCRRSTCRRDAHADRRGPRQPADPGRETRRAPASSCSR